MAVLAVKNPVHSHKSFADFPSDAQPIAAPRTNGSPPSIRSSPSLAQLARVVLHGALCISLHLYPARTACVPFASPRAKHAPFLATRLATCQLSHRTTPAPRVPHASDCIPRAFDRQLHPPTMRSSWSSKERAQDGADSARWTSERSQGRRRRSRDSIFA